MKTKGPSDHPPQYWPTGGRPIQPYGIGYDPLDPDTPSPKPKRYLLDPIHPALLELEPGDTTSFEKFIKQVGISEFLDWAYNSAHISAWNEIVERFTGDEADLDHDEIKTAWCNPTTIKDVSDAQAILRDAFEEARELNDLSHARQYVLDTGWENRAFFIELDLDPETGVMFERPEHLWSRAWFELLEGLGQGKHPKACEYCSSPFIPTKINQRYCPGTDHQQRAYDRGRSRTPARRQYQREYQRKRRAKNTPSTREEA